MIGRKNRSTRGKPATMPRCTPQIPHAARTRTRAAAVGSQRVNSSATVWPSKQLFFYWYNGGWTPFGSTRYCGHQWPIVPAPGDYDDGEIGGMIGRGNRSTRRKPVPLLICPPQTSHAARTGTRTAAVESQRLTA
jgi:hypothetical protein